MPVVIVKTGGDIEPETARGMPAPPVSPAAMIIVVFTAVVAWSIVVILSSGAHNIHVGNLAEPVSCPEIHREGYQDGGHVSHRDESPRT